MKSPRFRPLLIVTAFAAPVLAHAHPGHDGDHDFVWEFGHLLGHPLATIACVSLLAAAGWSVWCLLKSRPPEKAKRLTRR